MRQFLWFVSALAAVIAAAILVLGLTTATGAPQEAAVAAIAVAVAVLPYCLARAVSGIVERRERNLEQINMRLLDAVRLLDFTARRETPTTVRPPAELSIDRDKR